MFADNCGRNITLEVVGDLGNNTWVKGHNGPIVRGKIRKPEGLSSTLIEGRVDGVDYKFNVDIVCRKENNGIVSFSLEMYMCSSTWWNYASFMNLFYTNMSLLAL